jgi:hypothetical protein
VLEEFFAEFSEELRQHSGAVFWEVPCSGAH